MPANSKILPETMLAPETGLPLHRAIRPFEVRYKGVAQNPNRFLQVSAATARAK